MDEDTKARLRILESALGKTEEQVRAIIRLPDGNIYRHEINGVMIKLFSTSSEAFNEGVNCCLDVNKRNPYSKIFQYQEWIQWSNGFDSCELALKLHGRKAVMATL